jgi:membrane-bound lytic murein transglycosylase MltF
MAADAIKSPMRRGLVPVLASLACVCALASAQAQPPEADAEAAPQGLEHGVSKPWLGDFDGMLERRQVRILVVPSRTYYFVDRGTQRGLSYDRGKAFEEEINRERGRKGLRVDVVFVPVSQDDLLPALIQGRGDIAAANLTITPERQAWVDFSAPLWSGVDEIVVTGPASPELRSLDDLSGQEIFVRLSSSYFQSLWHLNERFGREGKPPLRIKPAPEALADEDLLEMLNAGLVAFAVVDAPKAEFWAQVLPDIRLHPELAVRSGGEIAWAFRKQSPQLKAKLDAFAARHGKGTAFGNQKFREYLKNAKYVKNAASQQELVKFLRTLHFFQKYAAQYDFDWLMLAAQGYQESRLDQGVKSPVGAIGVMQVMPATGKELKVGDIRQTENNIHAGAKYMRTLLDRYFPGANFDAQNRCLFAFAAYNAGPARVAGLRKQAAARGLDPDVWFNNVELIAAEKVGQEPVRYVANIFKYYVAYQLVVEQQQAREQALRDSRAAPPAPGAR